MGFSTASRLEPLRGTSYEYGCNVFEEELLLQGNCSNQVKKLFHVKEANRAFKNLSFFNDEKTFKLLFAGATDISLNTNKAKLPELYPYKTSRN